MPMFNMLSTLATRVARVVLAAVIRKDEGDGDAGGQYAQLHGCTVETGKCHKESH